MPNDQLYTLHFAEAGGCAELTHLTLGEEHDVATTAIDIANDEDGAITTESVMSHKEPTTRNEIATWTGAFKEQMQQELTEPNIFEHIFKITEFTLNGGDNRKFVCWAFGKDNADIIVAYGNKLNKEQGRFGEYLAKPFKVEP